MPPSSSKPRSFTLTMTEKEYRTLKRLAKRDDRSMAGYLRRLIKEADEAMDVVDRFSVKKYLKRKKT